MSLPHFLVLGAMKSASTSLFRWLGEHPKVRLPPQKEPGFFAVDRTYAQGVGWYESLFPPLGPGQVTGEASVRYSDPEVAGRSAARAEALVPDARLVFVVRDPVARARSHYRHELQRGRERRPFPAALADPMNPYVRVSCYDRGLEPWLARYPRHRIHVTTFDELVEEGGDGFGQVLDFLELDRIPCPGRAYNVASRKTGFSPLMRWLYDRRITGHQKQIPRWVRRAARSVLLREPPEYAELVESAGAPVPPGVAQALAAELRRLERRLGRPEGSLEPRKE